jgi:hypothetical protein
MLCFFQKKNGPLLHDDPYLGSEESGEISSIGSQESLGSLGSLNDSE